MTPLLYILTVAAALFYGALAIVVGRWLRRSAARQRELRRRLLLLSTRASLSQFARAPERRLEPVRVSDKPTGNSERRT